MKIISNPQVVEVVYYRRDFIDEKNDFSYSFPCDKEGYVDEQSMEPIAIENYKKCLNGVYDLNDNGMVEHRYSYTEPALGICEDCDEEIMLHQFTNECECGAFYNMSGWRLKDPSEWEEEW